MIQSIKHARRSARTVSTIVAVFLAIANSDTNADPHKNDPRHAMTAALSASRSHPSLGDQAKVFDRMVGTWDCDYGFYAKDGSVSHIPGELKFGWILDGRAIQDIWIAYPQTGSKERSIGTSVRFFDDKTKQWRVIFVSPAYGALVTVQGGVEGNRIILRGVHDEGSLLRWSFNDIRANSFVWRGEKSRDGGKTWRLEEEHHMTRRSGVSPGTEMIRELAAQGAHASLGAQAQTFDRFVGAWDLDCDLYTEDGKTTHFRGSWIFGWVLEGYIMQDVLIEGDALARRGTTVRFYDAKVKEWRIVWIPPLSGNVITLKGGAVGDRIVLLGRDVNGSMLRWSFNDIQADSFLWRGETSSDGGKTWRTEQVMRLRRRAA